MNITEYHLIITEQHDCPEDRTEIMKSLIYRGNQNIIIRSCASDDDEAIEINIPRHILERFLEMIAL